MTAPKEGPDTAELIAFLEVAIPSVRAWKGDAANILADKLQEIVGRLQALQARVLKAETANIGYRMERDEDHATIARLREVLFAVSEMATEDDGAARRDPWDVIEKMATIAAAAANGLDLPVATPNPDTGTIPNTGEDDADT